MLGAIIGDIVGSPYELEELNIKTTEFPLFSQDSTFTDDSVMTIAVAEALENSIGRSEGEIRAELVRCLKQYGRQYPEAGYGGRFLFWLNSELTEPYNSWGNGSAMRVSSAGWLGDSPDEVRRLARLSAAVTHNHPEGLRGAEAVASAVYFARTGANKSAIAHYIETEFGYPLSIPLDELRPVYHYDVSCGGSVPPAIRAFLEGESFEEVIRLAVSIGGDSDTIAAMAGSIAEGMYPIPEKIRSEALRRLGPELRDTVEHLMSHPRWGA